MKWLVLIGAAGLISCGGRSEAPVAAKSEDAAPIGRAITVSVPLGLPALPVPEDNPPTAETIALGEKLFFSPLLSVDGTLSCATCHDPAKGFADGRQFSEGLHRKLGNRNAPSVVNAAYSPLLFWDGRAAGLEGQASGPMMNPIEMGHTVEGVERGIAADAGMRELFERAFGTGPVTMAKITKAIAAYERTLLRGNSPVDRYLFGGDKNALSDSARRGLEVFRDPKRGNCSTCHTVTENHALFTDNLFHNLGVGLSPEGEITDPGRFAVTKLDAHRGAFRTPSLRNVALTAPYMHDGSLKTLKEVVDFYVGGGSSNEFLDRQIRPLTHLSRQDRADLVAMLEALTGKP